MNTPPPPPQKKMFSFYKFLRIGLIRKITQLLKSSNHLTFTVAIVTENVRKNDWLEKKEIANLGQIRGIGRHII